MYLNNSQRGVSLIELVLFIVIIGIALISLLLVMNVNTKSSADPMLNKQALAVAESMLEEVEHKAFANPVGGFGGATIQSNRGSFDSIDDYDGFATTGIYPADGSATAINGLTGYNVSVAVVAIAWGTITLASGNAVQITVTVTNPQGIALQAIGYRVNY